MERITYTKYEKNVMKAEVISEVARLLLSCIGETEEEIKTYGNSLDEMERNNNTKDDDGDFTWSYQMEYRRYERECQRKAIYDKLIEALDKMM